MALTVHRIEIPITDRVDVHVPGFIRPLHVDESRSGHGFLEVWYETDTSNPGSIPVAFAIHGTGHPVVTSLPYGPPQFLGTVVARNGLVWHVYTAALTTPAATR